MVEAGVLTLQGVVQHYDWGGHNFIPDLLGDGKRDPQTVCRTVDRRACEGAIHGRGCGRAESLWTS